MTEAIPNAYYRTSIKALILDETRTKFLLCEEENHRYDFPGGGLDFGETPQECVIREVKEEMGLVVTSVADNPSFFIAKKKDWGTGVWIVNVFYETVVADLKFTPSEECVALKFVSVEDIQGLDVYSNVKMFAEQFAKSLKK